MGNDAGHIDRGPGETSTSGAPSTPPADAWRTYFASRLPSIEALARAASGGSPATTLRSAQVDASRLDEELTTMLREQFAKVYALFDPQLMTRLQPELTAALDLLVFWFSVWAGKATPGSMLLNLRYRDERAIPCGAPSSSTALPGAVPKAVGGGRTGVEGPGLSLGQRAGLGLGWVALRYAWVRLCIHAAGQHWGDDRRDSGSWQRRAWVAMRQAETCYKAASFLNFLVFLRTGTYRSLLERLLRARLVYSRPVMSRALSFEYLNRQLVWSEVSELFLFVLPLVDVRRARAALRRALPNATWAGAPPKPGGEAASGSGATGASSGASAARLPCGVCGRREMAIEVEAVPCGHRFCYYCLRSNTQSDLQYECPTCLVRVDAMRRTGVPAAAADRATGNADGSGASARGKAVAS